MNYEMTDRDRNIFYLFMVAILSFLLGLSLGQDRGFKAAVKIIQEGNKHKIEAYGLR